MRSLACAIAFALVTFISAPTHAEIYRWVDANGITHLDDDVDNVPEAERPDAKIFHAKAATAPPEAPHGATQGAFATGIARELGLMQSDSQDAVSVLHIVGIYPSRGWNPAAALTAAVTDEVTSAARAAGRAHRLGQSEAAAEAGVLRIAAGLGVAGPAPSAPPEPLPQPAPAIVFAPSIVVEAPPPTVVVHTIEREPPPMLTRYGFDNGFVEGTLFAPIHGKGAPGPIPNRIIPLSNPAGHLRGPLVQPMPRPGPFQRPPNL